MLRAFQRLGVPMENIPKTQFTLFTSPVSSPRHIGQTWTLEDLRDAIVSARWHDLIAAVRELAPYKKQKDHTGKRKSAKSQAYSRLKETTLPYAVVSGTWDPDHRHADGARHKGEPCDVNGLLSPSGLRLLDLDDLDSTDRDHIMSELRGAVVPWAAACWLSPGGDGLHLIAALDPAPVCQADSYIAFTALVGDLSHRLPVASVASDPAAKNLMRPSFVSDDPGAWLADSPRPFRWREDEQTAHPDENSRPSARQQMEDVARDLVASGLDYNDWFGLMGALKSAGMDIAALESIASAGGDRYVPGEIKRKWAHLLPSDNPAAVVNGMAKKIGIDGRVVDQDWDPPNRDKTKNDRGDDPPNRGNAGNDQDEDEEDAGRPSSPNTGPALARILARVDHGIKARRNIRSGFLEVKPSEDWLSRRDFFRSTRQPDGWVPIDDMAAEAICDDISFVVQKRARPSAAKFLRMVKSLGSLSGHYADPFIGWLEGLPEWDGDNRYADAAVVGLKADPHARSLDWLVAATRIILNGVIQRAYEPGCIHDICVTLIGDEGTGKTTGMRELLPFEWQDVWYRKSLRLDRNQKELIEDTRGYVIVECSELEGLDHSSRSRVKNLIDDPFDIAREAYGRTTTKQARSFILVGTANDEGDGLFDIEGKQRRFWPVPVRKQISLKDLSDSRQWLNDNRSHLWAQALSEYRDYDGPSDSWRPPASLSHEHRAAVDAHRANSQGGDIAASLTAYVMEKREVEPMPLAHFLFEQQTVFPNASTADEVSALLDRQQKLQREITGGMIRLGWKKKTATRGRFKGRRVWVPPA